jgi:cell division protein FtsB
MFSVRTRIVIAALVLVSIGAAWVGLDRKGVRLWWRLGDDVSRIEHDNAALTADVDVLQRKAAALRHDAHSLDRAARESGYVHDNEVLIQLK